MILQIGGKHRLELGCGRRKHDDSFVGVDRLPLMDVESTHQVPDIISDLDSFSPTWKSAGGNGVWAQDNSCSFIIAHQTLEHIQNLIPFMNEVYRIADDDCWFEVIVPYYKSAGAFQDPTHVRFFTEMTLRYWEPGMVEDFSDYGIKGHFGLADQRWRNDGNLWALLRPLKMSGDQAIFTNWLNLSDRSRSDFPMTPICPPELLARCTKFDFLGWNP